MRYPIHPTIKFRRGDSSPEHPGLIFFVREREREVWLPPEEFAAKKQITSQTQKRAMDKWCSKPENVEIKRECYRKWAATDKGRATRREVTKRYLGTVNGNVCNRYRSRIREAVIRGSNCMEWLLGCSVLSYEMHLESQFTDGMTWENMGKCWEIDHIEPLSLFDLGDEQQQKAAFNFKNTRPMLKQAHRMKSDKITHNGKEVRARSIKPNVIPFKEVA